MYWAGASGMIGSDAVANSPEDFRRQILRDIELYRKMVPLLGLKPE